MITKSDFPSLTDERCEPSSRSADGVTMTKAVSFTAIIVPVIAIVSFYFCLLRYCYNFPYFDDF